MDRRRKDLTNGERRKRERERRDQKASERERCLRSPSREGKSKGVSGGEERSLRGQL